MEPKVNWQLDADRKKVRRRTPAVVRIVAKLIEAGNCLIWAGYSTPKGAGKIKGDDGKLHSVHRLMWEHYHGTASSMQIVQTCGNSLCCAKDHLREISRKQANARRRPRSQWTFKPRKERVWVKYTKLSNEKLLDMTAEQLAERFGVACTK